MSVMNDYSDEEQEALSDDEFFDSGLRDLERRRELEMQSRLGTDIQADLRESGPLYLYVLSRRKEAAEALRVLVTIDPADARAIQAAQAEVHEYLRVFEWVHLRAQDAEHADATINEEFKS
jgi:hypothetical protein